MKKIALLSLLIASPAILSHHNFSEWLVDTKYILTGYVVGGILAGGFSLHASKMAQSYRNAHQILSLDPSQNTSPLIPWYQNQESEWQELKNNTANFGKLCIGTALVAIIMAPFRFPKK